MIEKPPRFGSQRFREILAPAFKGDPVTALDGLYLMATRRRVRGWSRLMVAASNAPLNYLRWIKFSEQRGLREFRQLHPSYNSLPIVSLVLDQGSAAEDFDATMASIREAFADAIVYSTAPGEGGSQQLPGADLRGAVSALAERHEGAWFLPIRAGDLLSPALGEVLARSIGPRDDRLAYWDEDRLEAGTRRDPWVKPDWDPLLFGALGGLVGASAASLAALRSAAGSALDAPVEPVAIERLLFDIAQANPPNHVSLILSHRRGTPREKKANPLPLSVPTSWPSVSIIIPTRDRPELLAACIAGVESTEYPGGIQIIIVDNGSRDPAALELLECIAKDARATVLRDDGPFNFSRLNNRAATVTEGELLCLLNNDVEPLDRDWLTGLVRYLIQDGIGAVGAQLVYPSGRIQHAGVSVGLGGAAGHVQKGVDPEENRFWTWHAMTREVSALTAAVLVVKKKDYFEVGGFDEDFAVAFNDVDFCLRLKQRGLRNIYVAEVRLLHRESESRGKDRSPEQARRFAGELARLQARWGTEDYSDPHFSPLFSRLVERCVLAP